MTTVLPARFIELAQDALLKSYWRKKSLRNFLRRSQIPETFLAQLQDSDTKRDWLDFLFPKLEATEKGQLVIQKMARSLADQTAFPDLANFEESTGMLAAAKSAVTLLREYLCQAEQESAQTKDAVRRRAAAEDNRVRVQRSQADLGKLKDRLDSLCLQIGTQQGGYAFQEWFYDLIDFFEVENRRPYISDGRHDLFG